MVTNMPVRRIDRLPPELDSTSGIVLPHLTARPDWSGCREWLSGLFVTKALQRPLTQVGRTRTVTKGSHVVTFYPGVLSEDEQHCHSTSRPRSTH